MKYLFEIVSLKPYDTEALVPYDPFVYKVSMTLTGVSADLLALFPGLSDYDTARVSVQQIAVGLVEYTSVSSLALCIATEGSYYWDAVNQDVYIHYEHDLNPFAEFLEIGVVLGFTDSGVEFFNDVPYKPLVASFPDIYEQVDALLTPTMAFSDISVTLKNDTTESDSVQDGYFDTDPKLYGMTCRILRGQDGDAYGDLELVTENTIQGYTLDIENDELVIHGEDKRRQLETKYPSDKFFGLAGLASDNNDIIVPDGFGAVIQTPAYAHTVGSTSVRFRWATVATSIDHVYIYTEQNGIEEIYAPNWGTSTASPLAEGYLYILNAKAYADGDTTKNLNKVFVTGTMRPEVNPADIIRVLNSAVLDVTYTADNYNLTEWAAEKAALDNVSLHMDTEQELYRWIEQLQTWSNRPFRYEHQSVRTLRVYDPERAPVSLSAIEVEVESIESSGDDFYSSVEVLYAKNHRLETWSSYTADEYELAAYREHRQYATISIESGLTAYADAQDKADFYHEQTYQTRSVFTVLVDASRISPRIWDMVTIDTSELGRTYRGEVLTSIISIQVLPDTNQYRLALREA